MSPVASTVTIGLLVSSFLGDLSELSLLALVERLLLGFDFKNVLGLTRRFLATFLSVCWLVVVPGWRRHYWNGFFFLKQCGTPTTTGKDLPRSSQSTNFFNKITSLGHGFDIILLSAPVSIGKVGQ